MVTQRIEISDEHLFDRRRDMAGGALGAMVAVAICYDANGDVSHVLMDDRKLILVPVKPRPKRKGGKRK